MVEETLSPETPAGASGDSTVAPVTETPAAVVEPPVAETAPEAPAAPAAEPVEESLLSKFGKEEGEKPAEEPKPAEEKPAEEAAKPTEEAKPAEAPAAPEPVVYEDFAFPEGLAKDESVLADFTATIGQFGVPQEAAQKLVDLHNSIVQKAAEEAKTQFDQHIQNGWVNVRKQWEAEARADPVIGTPTAMGALARMRDLLFTPEMRQPRQYPNGQPRRSEMEEYLDDLGNGSNLTFLKLLHNVAAHFDEAPLPPPNPKPSPDPGGPKNRRAILYDNPRSPGQR